MKIQAFHDPSTGSMTYLIAAGGDAVIVDPVWDYDAATGTLAAEPAPAVLAAARGLRVHYVLDTHVHADHITAASALARALGARTAIGAHVTEVQARLAPELGIQLEPDGSQWDVLLHEGEPLLAGALRIDPLHCPGHTPSCYAYRIGDAVFTGDVLFMPDFGTGRCDFPGGSARSLYRSIQRLYGLPAATRVFVGHDYAPGGRPYAWETDVGTSRTQNVHLKADTDEDSFVAFRTARDATLSEPKLLRPSLTANLTAGPDRA